MKPTKIKLVRTKPWRAVRDLHEAKGFSRADALNLVIVEWLLKGDTEPLLDAIETGEVVDPVLSIVALMVTRDESLPYYLAVHRQPGQIGAPEKPGLQWRDAFATLAYEERCKEVGSEKAFQETADNFGISASAIRSAVTRFRKMGKKSEILDPPTTKKS
jgi:hypothetical protein